MAIKGFNTDLTIEGSHFHIQTEDWGEDNPILVSRVFCNGAVVQSVKTPYDLKLLKRNYLNYSEAITKEMKKQHAEVIEELQLQPRS